MDPYIDRVARVTDPGPDFQKMGTVTAKTDTVPLPTVTLLIEGRARDYRVDQIEVLDE